MLHIEKITVGLYQTNVYLFWQEGEKTCCIVDPGYEPETILERVRELGLTVDAILLTHGHFDHVGGVKTIAADTGCRVFLCPEELTMPPQLTAGRLYYTDTYEDGDRLTLAGTGFTVLRTPGHTPGSVCLLAEDVMFSGDTLFAGSCGRTDLPGGNASRMKASLARIAALEGDYRVLPGHGGVTTLEHERQNNPYLSL